MSLLFKHRTEHVNTAQKNIFLKDGTGFHCWKLWRWDNVSNKIIFFHFRCIRNLCRLSFWYSEGRQRFWNFMDLNVSKLNLKSRFWCRHKALDLNKNISQHFRQSEEWQRRKGWVESHQKIFYLHQWKLFQFFRLYRGLYTPLCTVALTNAVTFGVYGIMSRNLGNNTIGDIARNGSVAGFIRVINQKFIALSAKPYIIVSRHLL